MNGLSVINIELTSRCNKACFCCGRRKVDRDGIAVDYGDMSFDLIQDIHRQVPDGILIQFHWNGEPTLYPRLGDALKLFKNCIKQFDTNGKLLVEKADEIIGNLDILTLSVIQDDPEGDEQYDILRKFLEMKGDRKPRMVYRLLGKVDKTRYENFLQGLIATRTLHDPMGSFDYEKPVTIPEHGICLDFLTHLAIDRLGNVSPCVRFDPGGLNIIGSLNDEYLSPMWNGKKRNALKKPHIDGKRNEIPFCSQCDYYGIPIG